MTEEDAYNLSQMMLHYSLLSLEARKRAREVFKQLLEAAKEDEEKQKEIAAADAPEESEGR